jgi:hypothetical protein
VNDAVCSVSRALVHHQVLVIVFVIHPKEDIFMSSFPDNDAINVITKSCP